MTVDEVAAHDTECGFAYQRLGIDNGNEYP